MKRRNVDLSKLRRPLKTKKVPENVSTSVFGYLRFLAVWGLVLLADFLLEFRFEYLYPVWLLLRSLPDSYKYQGLVLTTFFVLMALGTDCVCYIFIPVDWLFFAASSYVWVQYIWHTDRGLGLPTLSLWLLFIYVEAALRMKDQKILPFNMDLCRPFAAHCIGYPVVTLGYGMKTAATETLRKRTQNKVQKRNKFYLQLLEEALPVELQNMEPDEPPPRDDGDDSSDTETLTTRTDSNMELNNSHNNTTPNNKTHHHKESNKSEKTDHQQKTALIEEFDVNAENEMRELKRRNINEINEDHEHALSDSKSKVTKDPVPKKLNGKKNKSSNSSSSVNLSNTTTTPIQQPPIGHAGSGHASPILSNGDTKSNITSDKSTAIDLSAYTRLECDIKRLKSELTASRNEENELRTELNNRVNEDRHKTVELTQLQQDNDNLQARLHNLVTSRQQDKSNLSTLEKKLQEEKKLREKSESALATALAVVKTGKKQDESTRTQLSNSRSVECVSGSCKNKINELEEDITQLKWDIKKKDDQIKQLESEINCLREHKEANHENRSVLMSAFAAMQEKTGQLEAQLNNENKVKLDLFSALNEARRNNEIQRQMLASKEAEIVKLRSHITEALALVPSSLYTDQSYGSSGSYTTPRLDSPTMANTVWPSMHQDMMYSQPYNVQANIPVYNQTNNSSPNRYSPSTPQPSATAHSPTRSSESDNGSTTNLNPQAQDYQPPMSRD